MTKFGKVEYWLPACIFLELASLNLTQRYLEAKVWAKELQPRCTINRSWVRILTHPTLDENVVKAMPS